MNGPLVEGGDVHQFPFDFAPDGRHVVYIAGQDTDGVEGLYISRDRPASARARKGYE